MVEQFFCIDVEKVKSIFIKFEPQTLKTYKNITCIENLKNTERKIMQLQFHSIMTGQTSSTASKGY